MLGSLTDGGLPEPDMIGRERELELVEASFEDARRNRAPAIARIVGESGIGKTFFLSRLARALESKGWLVVQTTCHAIQQHTPRLVANRFAAAALERVAPNTARYTSGLEDMLATFDATIARAMGRTPSSESIDADAYASTFLRLFEGIAIDHDVAILCDDTQWMDKESVRALLELPQKVSTGCIVLAVSRRIDDTADAIPWPSSTTVRLHELELPESLRVIKARLPSLDAQTAEMLAHHSAGRPLELVTLCEAYGTGDQADLERSLRKRIAQHLSTLSTEVRQFIQTCALLGDPIEPRILLSLYPDAGKLEDLIERSDRYVESSGGDLRFKHAMLAQSVIQSIAVPIPFHKRIITALNTLDDRQLSDYERIATHAAACGDTTLQLQTYQELAAEATRRQLWSAVLRASESVMALRPATEPHDPNFLLQYVTALRALDREPEAVDLLVAELPKLGDGTSEVIGELVALLVTTLGLLEREDQAIAVYRRYRSRLRDSRQLARAAVGAMFAALATYNEELFEQADTDILALGDGIEDYLLARREYARAGFLSTKGDYAGVKRAMASGLSFLDPARPRYRDLLLFGEMMYDFRELGCEPLTTRLPDLTQRLRFGASNNLYARTCDAWRSLFIGEWEAALAIVEQCYEKSLPLWRKSALLAIPTAMSVLAGTINTFAREAEETARALAEGQSRQSSLQLLPWLLIGRRDPHIEQFAMVLVGSLQTRPASILAIGYVPAAFSLWAASASNATLLRHLADISESSDRASWPKAQWALARGIALEALADPSAKAVLASATDDFRRLSAPFMAAYSAHKAGHASPEEESLLARVGVLKVTSSGRKSHAARDASLTPREWDVAHMVGKGATNRQTAEGLFVSERTVEVHLSNIFGKLGLSSRAQLVKWLYENASAS
jgi:DNA-binding CsgD family transcriptional regulator